MYKIGIIGYGVVGKGLHRLFGDDVKAIYDPFLTAEQIIENRIAHLIVGQEGFSDMDMVIVAVPTNALESGEADTSLVWETLQWLEDVIDKDAVTLIKSTVPPTEVRRMHSAHAGVVFSPEFQGESKYFTPFWKYPDPQDMRGHTWQVFGGDPKYTTICVDIFKRRMGVDTQFWQTDIVTASLAKYIENSFFAMKVTFVNEWFDIAESYNVDWNTLRELWLCDPRINRNHTLVFPKDRGYGGKCFPKDTKAIIKDLEGNYEPKLMKAMDEVNNFMRRKNEENS